MQRIRLHQYPIELNRLQQLAQSLNLASGIGGVGALGDRHTKGLGVEAQLGKESRCARSVFSDRARMHLAVTHQGVGLLGHTELRSHPVAREGFKAKHIQVSQQQPKRRIRRRLAEIGAQQRVKHLSVASDESLPAHQRTLANEDRHDVNQEYPPLGKAGTSAHPAIRQRLEEADQIGCSSRVGSVLRGKCSGAVPAHDTVDTAARRGLLGADFE
jgi:hypothetical protein